MSKKLNILFICKYNRFRSRVAESYFKKINKNKSIHVKSAGLIVGTPLNKQQVRAALEFNIKLNGKPRGLKSSLINWADLFVIAADNVPPSIFEVKKYHKKIRVWKVRDARSDDKPEVRRAIKEIMKHVESLVGELK